MNRIFLTKYSIPVVFSCVAFVGIALLFSHRDPRENNGLTIICLHIEGSELSLVKKAVNDHQLEYPICIDVKKRLKPGESELPLFPGEFSSQFGIHAIPHFVVLDQQGIVVASQTSRFDDALEIAKRLVNNPKSDSP